MAKYIETMNKDDDDDDDDADDDIGDDDDDDDDDDIDGDDLQAERTPPGISVSADPHCRPQTHWPVD